MPEIQDSTPRRPEPETNLKAPNLITVNSAYFSASIYPGMKIESGKPLFIYRGGVLKEKLGDELYKQFTLEEKKEVDSARSLVGEFNKNITTTQKVSLRNINYEERNGKIVAKADYVHGGIPFPLYKMVSDPKKENELDMAMPTATAAIVITNDHKIVIQNRSSENSRYAETLGASAAGLWDKTMDNGKVVPPSTKSATENMLKELKEEIGVGKEDINSIIITGISLDKVAVHTEVMFLVRLDLSSDQLEVVANQHRNTSGGFDFGEEHLLLDATPEAISTLLTKVKSPIASTHAAALLSVCLTLQKDKLLTQFNEEIANKKLSEYSQLLVENVTKNYEDIDLIAGNYWKENGNQYSKYEPTVKPKDQGLPDVKSELLRNGLIKDINTSREEN